MLLETDIFVTMKDIRLCTAEKKKRSGWQQ